MWHGGGNRSVSAMDHALFALVAAVSAGMQSLFGFGYAVLLVPVAALLIEPETAVAATIVTSMVITIALYLEHQPRQSVREASPLAVAGIVGVPLGLVILTQVSGDVLKLLIGFAVLASAGAGLVHGNIGRPRRGEVVPVMVGVGLLSGVLRGAVSMPGPPVLLYQHWRGGAPEAVRSAMFGFNGLLAIPAVIFAVGAGVVTESVLGFVAVALPGLAVGGVSGAMLRGHLSDVVFVRLSFVVLSGSATLGIASAVTALT